MSPLITQSLCSGQRLGCEPRRGSSTPEQTGGADMTESGRGGFPGSSGLRGGHVSPSAHILFYRTVWGYLGLPNTLRLRRGGQ